MTRDPDEEPLPPLLMREAGPVPTAVALICVLGTLLLWAAYLGHVLR